MRKPAKKTLMAVPKKKKLHPAVKSVTSTDHKTTEIVRPKRETIVLSLSEGPHPVEAEIVGDLAVHPTKADRKTFTVTHVPTKLGLWSVIPGQLVHDPKELVSWCRKVQETMQKDWLALRKYDHAKATEGSETLMIRERLKTHCKNIRRGGP